MHFVINLGVVDSYSGHRLSENLIFDEFPNQLVRLVRVREEITVALIRQYDKFGVGDALCQDFRRHSMIDFAGHVTIAVADENQRGMFDVFQSLAGVVALTRQQMTQVELHRAKVVHPDLQVVVDFFGMFLHIFFRPPHQDRVFASTRVAR